MRPPENPEARIAKVLSHPLRPRILQAVTARGEASPNELTGMLGETLARLSYHVRVLRDDGWLELARTGPWRGAT